MITVVLRVAIFWIPLAFSVHRNSFTWDADEHIYSGYMSWQHGDFGLNPEHPPLVKLIAALPLVHLPVKMPALPNRFFKLEGVLGGEEFFLSNDAEGMLFQAPGGVILCCAAGGTGDPGGQGNVRYLVGIHSSCIAGI